MIQQTNLERKRLRYRLAVALFLWKIVISTTCSSASRARAEFQRNGPPSLRCGAGEGSRRRLRCSARALEKGAIDARARGRCCAACAAAVTCIIDKIASPSCIFAKLSQLFTASLEASTRNLHATTKAAATLWPPPLDNFDYGPLPDERYTQALLAIEAFGTRCNHCAGALVSPRSSSSASRDATWRMTERDVYDGLRRPMDAPAARHSTR